MVRQGFRPARADDLGLRQALSDRLLPLLVAAMVFLAALALAGADAASGLARHWRSGAAVAVTVQVPLPNAAGLDAQAGTGSRRAEQAASILNRFAVSGSVRRLGGDELVALLRPWLGNDSGGLAAALPAVFEMRLNDGADAGKLEARLAQAAPGALVERNGVWLDRLTTLARSLQACAALALILVAGVAAALVAVATRAGLAARRDAIEILHGLGAADGRIAANFAARITWLAIAGSALGLAIAVPVLLGLASLAAPFTGSAPAPDAPALSLGALPADLWASLPGLPLAAAGIAWVAAQATVRAWLSRLP